MYFGSQPPLPPLPRRTLPRPPPLQSEGPSGGQGGRMGWGAVGESPWPAPVEVGEVGGEQRIRKVLLLARRLLSNLPSPTSQSPESGGVCSPRSHLGGWEAPRHRRRRPAQVTAPRPRRRRRPPLETSPGARSSDLSEPKRLPAEEEGLKDLPLEKLPTPPFSFAVSSSSSIFPPLHTLLSSSPTRFRTSRHKLQRQLCSLRGWEILLPSGICKTLWSGKSTEGLSPRFPLPRVCTERAS